MKDKYSTTRKAINLLVVLLMLLSTKATAQFEFLGDLNAKQTGGDITAMAHIGDTAIFIVDDADEKTGLWISDGTENGTKRLYINSVVDTASYPIDEFTYNNLLSINEKVLIATSRGYILTDGSDAGCEMANSSGTEMKEPLRVGNLAFFKGSDGIQRDEVWVTDGTVEGTHILKDINHTFLYESSSHPKNLTPFGNGILFSAIKTNCTKYSLYYSDGTEEGTVELHNDLTIGNEWVEDNGKMYFSGKNDTYGDELWCTDGTAEGTYLVKDIVEGTEGSEPISFFKVNNDIFFSAVLDNSFRIWHTNGTTSGTTYYSIMSGYERVLKTTPSMVYLFKEDGIYSFDGISTAKVKVQAFRENSYPHVSIIMGDLNNDLIVSSSADTKLQFDPTSGFELYNYTPSNGMEVIEDLNPLEAGDGVVNKAHFSYPEHTFINTGNSIYFYGSDGVKSGLFRLSHSPYKIDFLLSITTEGTTNNLLLNTSTFEDNFLFCPAGDSLGAFITDGTKVGTYKINKEDIGQISEKDGKYYLSTESGIVVKSDITDPNAESTFLMRGGSPHYFEASNKVLFAGYNESTGLELYETNGTPQTTQLFKDLYPGANNGLEIIFYSKSHGYIKKLKADGDELWITNGSLSGTFQASNFSLKHDHFDRPAFFGDTIIFSSDDGLAMSDGTLAGTKYIVQNLYAGNMVSLNNKIYFNGANTESGESGTYVTDGTSEGTIRICDEQLLDYYSYVYTQGDSTMLCTSSRYSGNTTTYITHNQELDVKSKDNPYIFKFVQDGQLYGIRLLVGNLVIQKILRDGVLNPIVDVIENVIGGTPFQFTEHGNYVYFRCTKKETGTEWYSVKGCSKEGVKLDIFSGDLTPYPVANGDEIDLHSVEPGDFKSKTVITILNSGSEIIQLSNPQFSGQFANYFSIVEFPVEIEVGGTAKVIISFYGNEGSGMQYTPFSFSTNDPEIPQVNVNLKVESRASSGINILEIPYGHTQLGQTTVGATLSKDFNIYNPGNGPLAKLDSVVISGRDKDDFSCRFSPQLIESIRRPDLTQDDMIDSLYNNPNFSAPLIIDVSATNIGEREALLTLYNNNTPNEPSTYTLSAEVKCALADSIHLTNGNATMCIGSEEWPTLSIAEDADASYCWSRNGSFSLIGDCPYATSNAECLVFDSNNNLTVAFINDVNIKRYENGTWHDLGATLGNTGSSTKVSLAYDDNDTLYAAFTNASNILQVYKYDETQWVKIEETGAPEVKAEYPSIAFMNNELYAFYMDLDYYGEQRFFPMLTKWTGSAWDTLSFDNQFNYHIKLPSMKSYGDKLYIAFIDGGIEGVGASVFTYDGSELKTIGERGFSDNNNHLDMAIDTDGTPYIITDNNEEKATVYYYKNNTWNALLVDDGSYTCYQKPRIAVHNHTIMVYYGYDRTSTYMDGVWNKPNIKASVPSSFNFSNTIPIFDNEGTPYANLTGWGTSALLKMFMGECLGSDADFTPTESGTYSCWKNTGGCSVKSLNSITVSTIECQSLLNIYNGGYWSISGRTQDFGNRVLGDTAIQTYQVRNEGNADLILTDEMKQDGDAKQAFSVLQQPDKLIPAGASSDIKIAFHPVAMEEVQTSFIVPYIYRGDTVVTSNSTITVKGAGSELRAILVDELVVDQNNNGLYDYGKDTIRFTFKVYNPLGAEPKDILYKLGSINNYNTYKSCQMINNSEVVHNAEIRKYDLGEINISNDELKAGDSLSITFDATLSVISSEVDVYMTGYWGCPISDDPTAAGKANPNVITVAPLINYYISTGYYAPRINNKSEASVTLGTDFGSVPINTSSAPKSYSIYHTGNTMPAIDSMYLTGPQANNFCITLDQYKNISVKFNPTQFDTCRASVNLITDSDTLGHYTFDIMGNGVCDTRMETEYITSCSPVTWIDGNTYTNSINTIHTYTDDMGCEVSKALNLSILDAGSCDDKGYGDCAFEKTIESDGNVLSTPVLFARYQWYNVSDEGEYIAIPEATEAEYTSSGIGKYAVRISREGCIDTSEVFNSFATGIQLNEQTNILLYPNPTSGKVYIKLPTQSKEVLFKVRSISGALIDFRTYKDVEKIDYILDSTPGLYFIEIQSEEYISTLRVIKK